jgi:hypothetical protein
MGDEASLERRRVVSVNQDEVRQVKLAGSSRCETGTGKGWRPPGSECCGVGGDDLGEAYTAIMRGVGVSHDGDKNAGAETFSSVEGNMGGADMRGAVADDERA